MSSALCTIVRCVSSAARPVYLKSRHCGGSRQTRNMSHVSYNWLGSSGIKVSNLCLGTMTFGEHPQGRPGCNEAESHAILDRFVALGGNFIDTADMYQMGKSEQIIGNWLNKQSREKLFLATKCGKAKFDPSDPNCIGANRNNIIRCLEGSLKRLQTDYVDLFYVHVWDDGTPIEETLSTLNYLHGQGKIRYIGLSNCKGWQLQKMVEVIKQRNWQPIVALQQQYSLLCRSTEWELVDVCKNEGIALLPWSPLKGGWLSGKMKRGMDAPAQDSRIAWSAGRAHHSHPDFKWFANSDHAWGVIDKCDEIAKSHGKTVAEVALRWLIQKTVVPSVVIGVRTLAQMEDNMGAASGWELTPHQMSELDAVSAIPPPYPYDYVVKDNLERQRP